MAEPIDLPSPQSELTTQMGKPRQELLELLQQIKDALDDHEARLDAAGH